MKNIQATLLGLAIYGGKKIIFDKNNNFSIKEALAYSSGSILANELFLKQPKPRRKLPKQAQQVWETGKLIKGKNPNTWRQDVCGGTVKHSDYGNRNSDYGWEKDHIIPSKYGGSNNIDNLQLLQWRTNVRKGDKIGFSCK